MSRINFLNVKFRNSEEVPRSCECNVVAYSLEKNVILFIMPQAYTLLDDHFQYPSSWQRTINISIWCIYE